MASSVITNMDEIEVLSAQADVLRRERKDLLRKYSRGESDEVEEARMEEIEEKLLELGFNE